VGDKCRLLGVVIRRVLRGILVLWGVRSRQGGISGGRLVLRVAVVCVAVRLEGRDEGHGVGCRGYGHNGRARGLQREGGGGEG
jgi:hypothetical protein